MPPAGGMGGEAGVEGMAGRLSLCVGVSPIRLESTAVTTLLSGRKPWLWLAVFSLGAVLGAAAADGCVGVGDVGVGDVGVG